MKKAELLIEDNEGVLLTVIYNEETQTSRIESKFTDQDLVELFETLKNAMKTKIDKDRNYK